MTLNTKIHTHTVKSNTTAYISAAGLSQVSWEPLCEKALFSAGTQVSVYASLSPLSMFFQAGEQAMTILMQHNTVKVWFYLPFILYPFVHEYKHCK